MLSWFSALRPTRWGSGVVLALLLVPLMTACAAAQALEATGQENPRLIVAISVDQLRGDLLDRYDGLFTGGLRRLRDQGLRFTNANHQHAITHTAPGHTTLATGVTPSRSGVVANTWFEQNDQGVWRSVYAVEDGDHPIVGFFGYPGRSPANLKVDGLADWVVNQNEDARVVSISRKDRAAITMAGRARGHVYWMLPEVPAFVTSTYYRDELPGWVEDFNQDVLVPLQSGTVWEAGFDAEAAALSRGDTAAYEADGVHTYFPHRYQDFVVEGDTSASRLTVFDWSGITPWPDKAVLDLAERAIQELDLGEDNVVDYLGLSLSQTDLVGHSYGPLSREQLSNLLHLDRELGGFLDYLDSEVGEGRWVLGLSSDHGVLTMPEYLAEQGEDARRFPPEDLQGVREILQQAQAMEDGPERAAWAAGEIKKLGSVADAYLYSELAEGQTADTFAALYAKSYYEGRATGVLGRLGAEVRTKPMVLFPAGPTGTSHGTPYWYDRWVPMVFLGPGVEAGFRDHPAETTDFAPTLARLGGVETPADLDGEPLIPIGGS